MAVENWHVGWFFCKLISHETARAYVKAVRRKLGGGSRLAAVASRWGR